MPGECETQLLFEWGFGDWAVSLRARCWDGSCEVHLIGFYPFDQLLDPLIVISQGGVFARVWKCFDQRTMVPGPEINLVVHHCCSLFSIHTCVLPFRYASGASGVSAQCQLRRSTPERAGHKRSPRGSPVGPGGRDIYTCHCPQLSATTETTKPFPRVAAKG